MDLHYSYANARIKGMKSKLFQDGKLRELLDVRSIPELIELLEESGYRESFVSMSTKYSGMELVVRALKDDFEKTLRKVVDVTPESGREMLKAFLREYEIGNIATILSAKATGAEVKDTDLIILSDESRRNLDKLTAARSLTEAVKELQFSEYAAAFSKVFVEYDRTRDFRVLTRGLYAYHNSRLAALARTTKNPLVKRFVRLKLELGDLMLLLRLKRSDAAASAMPFLTLKSSALLRELDAMTDFHKILARLKARDKKTASAVEEASKADSLIPLEIALERDFVATVFRQTRVSVLDISTIVGFLFLKQEEVGTIRKIAYAKQFGFTEDLKSMAFSFAA
ncbi:MAG: V-type ATPase subunit [Candidatus Micrarchaeota archaeon]